MGFKRKQKKNKNKYSKSKQEERKTEYEKNKNSNLDNQENNQENNQDNNNEEFDTEYNNEEEDLPSNYIVDKNVSREYFDRIFLNKQGEKFVKYFDQITILIKIKYASVFLDLIRRYIQIKYDDERFGLLCLMFEKQYDLFFNDILIKNRDVNLLQTKIKESKNKLKFGQFLFQNNDKKLYVEDFIEGSLHTLNSNFLNEN